MMNDRNEEGQLNLKHLIIGEQIGSQKASSSIHEAFNFMTNERFALKMLPCANDAEYTDASNDVRSFCEIRHPFIVTNYGSISKEFRVGNDTSRRTWIIYVLLERKQRSLDEIMNEFLPGRRRTVPPAEMSKLVFSGVVALANLQKTQRTMHGTIKPANIILDSEGVYKLSNVGTTSFQRLMQKYNKDRQTPDIRFWSLEALRSARDGRSSRYDIYKADIFSFGLTLLQAALPFEIPRLNDPRNQDLKTEIEKTIASIDPSYGAQFMSLLRKMLQVEPRARPDPGNMAYMPDFMEFTRTRMQDVSYLVNNDGARGPDDRRRLVSNQEEAGLVNLRYGVGNPGGDMGRRRQIGEPPRPERSMTPNRQDEDGLRMKGRGMVNGPVLEERSQDYRSRSIMTPVEGEYANAAVNVTPNRKRRPSNSPYDFLDIPKANRQDENGDPTYNENGNNFRRGNLMEEQRMGERRPSSQMENSPYLRRPDFQMDPKSKYLISLIDEDRWKKRINEW
eukprot:TRINITY_DN6539_c0_g1_i1.p1 TRINITY_DN6539_c0_g1~~TRINITY_DN6539_c0_g1_i1.p1  ORF type:complete len:506 (-),score=121.91 TRINITY_DN6539_c0_g1_i1:350-1867(-)